MISCYQSSKNGHVGYGLLVITIKPRGVGSVMSLYYSAIMVCSAENREHPLI